VPCVNIEHRGKAAALHIICDGIVVLHDEVKELLRFLGTLKDGCGVFVSTAPHKRQPFTGHNQVGAHQNASQEPSSSLMAIGSL